jgi:hypothetical protein
MTGPAGTPRFAVELIGPGGEILDHVERSGA